MAHFFYKSAVSMTDDEVLGKVNEKQFLRYLFKTRRVNTMDDASFSRLLADKVVINWLLAEYSKPALDIYNPYTSKQTSNLQKFDKKSLSKERIALIDSTLKQIVCPKKQISVDKSEFILMAKCVKKESESRWYTKENEMARPACLLRVPAPVGTVNILRNCSKAVSSKTMKPKSKSVWC